MDPALQEFVLADPRPGELMEAIVKLAKGAAPPPGLRIVARFGEVATCRLPVARIAEIWADEAVVSLKAPRFVASEPDIGFAEGQKMPKASRRTRSHRRSFSGEGTLVAAVDWGFDFTHPNFLDPATGATRFDAIWDQTAPFHPSAEKYGYGRVFFKEEIDRAILSERPFDALGYHAASGDGGDEGAHGSHVTCIAAGNGTVGEAGMAPRARIVGVHLSAGNIEGLANLGDSVRILEAIDFIGTVAGSRPVAINMSVGKHGGSHQGSSLVEQGMDFFLKEKPGRAIINSAGNYFSANIHASGTLTPGGRAELRWVVDEHDRTPNELEVWYAGRDLFSVTLAAPDGTAQTVKLGNHSDVAFGKKIVGRIYHRALEPNTGFNHIDIFLYKNAPKGIWEITLDGLDVVDGRYHAWIERDSGCRKCQSVFEGTGADPNFTTGSICNGFYTIAVGAFDPSAQAPATFSSAGPTADGRQKPNLLAPGVGIVAARSAPRSAARSTGKLTAKSGTSMAAPHVTGAVALLFEAAGRPLPIETTRSFLLSNLRPMDGMPPEIGPNQTGAGLLDVDAMLLQFEKKHGPIGLPTFPNHSSNMKTSLDIFEQAAPPQTARDLRTVTSGSAMIRTDPPVFTATRERVPRYSLVEVQRSAMHNGDEMVFVVRPLRPGQAGPAQAWGWIPAAKLETPGAGAMNWLSIKQSIVRVANAELGFWNGHPTQTETGALVRGRLRAYWNSLGNHPTDAELGSAEWQGTNAWSAAFICYVVRQAGAGDHFCYNGYHSCYVACARQNREFQNHNNPFWAYPLTDPAAAWPEPGDMLCMNYGGHRFTFDNIACGNSSHCDIVATTDRTTRQLTTIGGNIGGGRVARRIVHLDANGFIDQTVDRQTERPGRASADEPQRVYFAIIKVRPNLVNTIGAAIGAGAAFIGGTLAGIGNAVAGSLPGLFGGGDDLDGADWGNVPEDAEADYFFEENDAEADGPSFENEFEREFERDFENDFEDRFAEADAPIPPAVAAQRYVFHDAPDSYIQRVANGERDAKLLAADLFVEKNPSFATNPNKQKTDRQKREGQRYEALFSDLTWLADAMPTQTYPEGVPPGFKKVLRKNDAGEMVYRGLSRYSDIRLAGLLRQLRTPGLQPNIATLTDFEIDVLQAIANVETSGNHNGINTWDSATVSPGFMQLTLKHKKLHRWMAEAPADFARYGLSVEPDWKRRDIAGRYFGIAGGATRWELRTGDMARRFYLAANDPAILDALVKVARELLAATHRSLQAALGVKAPVFDAHFTTVGVFCGIIQEAMNNLPAPAKRGIVAAFNNIDAQTSYDDMLLRVKKSMSDAFARHAATEGASETAYRKRVEHIFSKNGVSIENFADAVFFENDDQPELFNFVEIAPEADCGCGKTNAPEVREGHWMQHENCPDCARLALQNAEADLFRPSRQLASGLALGAGGGHFFDAISFGKINPGESFDSSGFQIKARPRDAVETVFEAGDLILTRAFGEGRAWESMLATGRLLGRDEAIRQGFALDSAQDGLFAHVISKSPVVRPFSEKYALRIADVHGRVLPQKLILRARPTEGAGPGESIFTPGSPSNYAPSGTQTFRCSPPEPVFLTAVRFPETVADAEQVVEAALLARQITAQQVRDFKRRGGFEPLLPIARHTGEVFGELLDQMRWGNDWILSPKTSSGNLDTPGRHKARYLAPRLLLAVPTYFRELARQTGSSMEAFCLENLGWALAYKLRDLIATDTRKSWWLPPKPGFCADFPQILPPGCPTVISTYLDGLSLKNGATSRTAFEAKQREWSDSLAGQFWRAETGQAAGEVAGRLFYPGLVAIPAAVDLQSQKDLIRQAWRDRLAEIDRRIPVNDQLPTDELERRWQRRIDELTDRDTPHPQHLQRLFGTASLRGVELTYMFPMEIPSLNRARVRTTVRCLVVLEPVMEAVFAAVHELGWNDMLFNTAGSVVYRGTVRSSGPLARRHNSAKNISNHSFGSAIDLNELENLQESGPVPTPMHPRIVALFEAFGFNWGHCFTLSDRHHFEYGGNPQPGRQVVAAPGIAHH